jgi:ComF family protein
MLLQKPVSGKQKAHGETVSKLVRRTVARATAALDRRCFVCGARAGTDLCTDCFRDLPWNDHACHRCALPLPDLPATVCGACTRKPPAFDAARAAFAYAWPVDRLIQRFKFNGDLATGRILALALADYLDLHQLRRPDLLIPAPLHRGRLAERGFNQASEIARILARRLDTKVAFDGLARVRATPAQSGLDRAARRRNLRGAFGCRRPVGGLHIGVVDDVITTASTAEAIAHTLKRAGASRVSLYALARA